MTQEQSTQQAINALAQVHTECHQAIEILRHYGNCQTAKEKIRRQIEMLAAALSIL